MGILLLLFPAELVASSLKNKSYLIGERSFGKGSIQGLFLLDEHFAIKLTVAKFFTPSGDAIDEVGVKTDAEIAGYENQLLAAMKYINVLKAADII